MSGVSAIAHDGEHQEKVAVGIGAKIRGILGINSNKGEKQAEVKASVEVGKEEVQARKDAQVMSKTEKKVEQDKNKKENIQKFWNKMKHRLQILIQGQEKLANRIEKKLDKMKEDGRDVAAPEVKLDNAKVLVKAAGDALVSADIAVADAIKNNEPKVALEKVRTINQGILAKIKAAHSALVDLIRATNETRRSPTPTPTT